MGLQLVVVVVVDYLVVVVERFGAVDIGDYRPEGGGGLGWGEGEVCGEGWCVKAGDCCLLVFFCVAWWWWL